MTRRTLDRSVTMRRAVEALAPRSSAASFGRRPTRWSAGYYDAYLQAQKIRRLIKERLYRRLTSRLM